mmetsp:Transcript_9932/g.15346  ORF Transcript_9932/g.15346 Transcript_9932/m.15346 type:complete len:283 (+) Transcript_9932:127-975(+)|eukprot:CAMPEP_0118680122 /NCGR_PEP_ID=MMETSP0800-20121206/4176_1 /TAXON_ID=210618 ORGANISM="Striatella unipunctata, Strain CCMP2910" /NCGR_SAMPLE_ID=MMETSP0800 /ASSEMBLY_ACC=CAM_ASM_000638 /LENGTH=282 /DNA_ID=CAMNT_0006576209 /DNA_START=28 /DNA_END=876 /DNA_ORIENTATION=-
MAHNYRRRSTCVRVANEKYDVTNLFMQTDLLEEVPRVPVARRSSAPPMMAVLYPNDMPDILDFDVPSMFDSEEETRYSSSRSSGMMEVVEEHFPELETPMIQEVDLAPELEYAGKWRYMEEDEDEEDEEEKEEEQEYIEAHDDFRVGSRTRAGHIASNYHHHYHLPRENKTLQRSHSMPVETPKPVTRRIPRIEVEPGVFLSLRGSHETWEAVQRGRMQKVECWACSTDLLCLMDADYVLCPECRGLTPILTDVERPLEGGVGLGLSYQKQSESFVRRALMA